MMSEDFQDEITSINSIYGDHTITPVPSEPSIYALVLPAQPTISIRVDFPSDYPDVPPAILGTQSVGNGTAKGEGTYVVDLVREVLADFYTPGAPCIFDVIEESGSRLQQLGMDQSAADQEQQAGDANGQIDGPELVDRNDADDQQHVADLGDAPSWIISEVITEKKSAFVARVAHVQSIDQAQRHLGHLLATDKKVAKATHNITAWRIHGDNGVQYQDCDDDGETAAGGRLLHLLELMGVWDAMVVVTRWYGGVHLGPDRFRIINQAARDALVKAGFAQDTAKDGKEAGKKKHDLNSASSADRTESSLSGCVDLALVHLRMVNLASKVSPGMMQPPNIEAIEHHQDCSLGADLVI
nr:protein impact like [Quercus suber]